MLGSAAHHKIHAQYIDIIKIEKFSSYLKSVLKYEKAFDYLLNYLE